MNITNAIDRFTRQLAANGRSGHTQAAYRRDLGTLGRWMGKKPELGKITPDLLARFLTSDAVLQMPDGLPRSPMSVNRTKSASRSFFAFCVESGWLKDNPARLIRSSPATAKEPTTLTNSDIAAMRAEMAKKAVTDRDRLIFELLLGTGMRLGSLVALNLSDVDLKSRIIHIRTKGGGRDKVYLNPQLHRLITRYLRNLAPEANTSPASPLFRSVHSLRHTFATRLYRKTGDLHLVQRALGHRQITTTEIYAQVSDSSLRRAVGAA